MAFDRAYTDYQLKRSLLRKFIRRFYLRHTLSFTKGKTIDFGCGIGELLQLLPKGSLGYEVNENTVAYCLSKGLNVRTYCPEIDDYRLLDCREGDYESLVLSHVLEHLEHPAQVLRKLLRSCRRIGIRKVVVVVPCEKGFRFDRTHRTYISLSYIRERNLVEIEGFRIVKTKLFPFKCLWASRHFVYNELLVVYKA